MRGYGSLNETCQREMSRAVRLALWDFQKGRRAHRRLRRGRGHRLPGAPSHPAARAHGLASRPCVGMLHMRCVQMRQRRLL